MIILYFFVSDEAIWISLSQCRPLCALNHTFIDLRLRYDFYMTIYRNEPMWPPIISLQIYGTNFAELFE